MVDPGARRSELYRDPWLIMAIFLGVACLAPLMAQLFGWWHTTAAQRDAALTLGSGAILVVSGGNLLFGRRRWPVSRRPKDVAVLAFLGLSVASGIIAIVTGAGLLLGAFAALPVSAFVFQSASSLVFITVLLLRP